MTEKVAKSELLREVETLRHRVAELESRRMQRSAPPMQIGPDGLALQGLLDSSPIGVAVSQIDDGAILFANSRCARTFGTTVEEFLGTSNKNLWLTPEQGREFLDCFRKTGWAPNRPVRLRRFDGSDFRSFMNSESDLRHHRNETDRRRSPSDSGRTPEQREREDPVWRSGKPDHRRRRRDRRMLSVSESSRGENRP